MIKEKELKKLKTLQKIDIDLKIKKKLMIEAKRWRDFIKEDDMGDATEPGNELHYMYHLGEISFIEFFFNLNKSINHPLSKTEKTHKKRRKTTSRSIRR
jgi:hypothetical protein